MLKKYTHIKIQPQLTLKALAASLLMALALLALANQNLFTLISVGFIVYVMSLYWLRGFSKADVLEIMNLKKS